MKKNTEILFRIPEVVDIALLYANDWNPNNMPKKEMALLAECISIYGFLFPIIVTKIEDRYMIIDGFHRWETLKKMGAKQASVINLNVSIEQAIQLTILMNRIKGMHQVEKMSKVTQLLSKYNVSDLEICENLGMEAEEFIRLKQQIGVASAHKNHVYSKDWAVSENDTEAPTRQFGRSKGRYEMKPDFDKPLEDFKEYE